ncbi:MAG: inositol monophosphatase family protein [Pseudomonadota bacterium]
MARSAIMNVMVQTAMKAGRGLVRDFGEVQNLQVSVKGPGDFVSQADHRAEKTIHYELSKARPDYGFVMEESGAIEGADAQHRFIVDPLDGTTNFLHGIPHFAVSIALESQGLLRAAVIYNPVSDELFTAERGDGAYLNDRRMRVAGRREMTDSLFGCGIPFLGRRNSNHGEFLLELRDVMANSVGIRRNGAAALDLAYVAAGRLDGYWERAISPWDIAAGVLLVREAGGFVTDLNGGEKMFERNEVIAGNERLHRQLLNTINGAHKTTKTA